ncbi:GDSL esterase/lipase At4g10955-like isoform X2 [Impatiens glandulifera]|uniref:GDSL esterase/lipase At4g10955-like isoform X2 n=1 Tax=Impatiens glandulifera TaxID=253017 RepID=UPI001FB0ABE8|nr:GDSL esterase/lipase At4g10955-like isoform X2 [Impatiens glandulifera]
MASDREIFDLAGPLYLANNVNWSNGDHRRSVAACLVQGVYILERDRQENRHGLESFAPPWWEFFGFKLHNLLIDNSDNCIFGAIYEHNPQPDPNNRSITFAQTPRYVIAFRGTLTKGDAFVRDLQLDIDIVRNGLHRSSRFETAIQAVRNTVANFGKQNVWLTGHSLEAFLFNPPFFSAPIELIKDKKVKQGIRIASSFLAAGFAVALKNRRDKRLEGDSFAAFSDWVPSLFVHPRDHICSEYIGYFEHRKKMEEIGAGAIERLATQNSLGGLFMSAIGKQSSEEDPLHLIPSANLTVNLAQANDIKQAHGIHQWWQSDLQSHSEVHLYS